MRNTSLIFLAILALALPIICLAEEVTYKIISLDKDHGLMEFENLPKKGKVILGADKRSVLVAAEDTVFIERDGERLGEDSILRSIEQVRSGNRNSLNLRARMPVAVQITESHNLHGRLLLLEINAE